MNTVILTSVLSAGNHALFAGTRVLYGMAIPPRIQRNLALTHSFRSGLAAVNQAPKLFLWTTRAGVPLPSLLLTSSISALCFGSSYVGSGQLWGWLQNLVGVSNQVGCSPLSHQDQYSMYGSFCKIAWLSIGLASWRFRKAWVAQGRSLDELKFRASWTWPWGPFFVVSVMRHDIHFTADTCAQQIITVTALILSKSCVLPRVRCRLKETLLMRVAVLQSRDGLPSSPISLLSTSFLSISKFR